MTDDKGELFLMAQIFRECVATLVGDIDVSFQLCLKNGSVQKFDSYKGLQIWMAENPLS